ncbi:alpha/beta hydrolase [Fulvivirga sedimenti]|uniref:Alpha/beta hydrolase n=1 Tax=Fulvivirga sedimenti TaxID=2879465 RepID=A0A9X1HNA2_9BACT|nr:alpha/beta hydrolase [Fulvivirga sedimenti]MCA6074140.1 alpha/beta hydrolase [Fulvivirga sedimenti]
MQEFNVDLPNLKLTGGLAEAARPVGIVVFVHGMGEHIGRYTGLFDHLSSHGFHCLGTDHPGHGHSPGKRGHVKDYNIFMDELQGVIGYAQSHYPGLPLFLYGHSLGGNIVLNYLLRRPVTEIRAAIVSSPWLKLDTKVPPVKKFLSSVLARISPGLTVSNELDPRGISTIPEEVERYSKDPLVHDQISVGLFNSVTQAADYVLENGSKLKTPILLMHGTADPITSHLGSIQLEKSNEMLIDLKLFPGNHHEIHHDRSRDSLIHAVDTWLTSHLN